MASLFCVWLGCSGGLAPPGATPVALGPGVVLLPAGILYGALAAMAHLHMWTRLESPERPAGRC